MTHRRGKSRSPRVIRVFMAAPGDLAVERRLLKETIERRNARAKKERGPQFVALGWEGILATAGRRSRDAIFEEIDSSDVFVLALHRRWGWKAPDARPCYSHIEQAFRRARDRFLNTGAPAVLVFCKMIDAASMADPGPQLGRVLKFRRSLEASGQVRYWTYGDAEEFQTKVDRQLQACVEGELPAGEASRVPVAIPLENVRAVERAASDVRRLAEQLEAKRQLSEAHLVRRAETELVLASQAASAALEGRVEEARQVLALATAGTASLSILALAFEFYFRTGELGVAEAMIDRWLAIHGHDPETTETATALANLGLICERRGELDRGEELLRQSLTIDEHFGHQEGLASDYGNLGLIYEQRGDLNRAEEMLREALAIDERLGRDEGLASEYGSLGVIYRMRCQTETARQLWTRARDLYASNGIPDMATKLQKWLDGLPVPPSEQEA